MHLDSIEPPPAAHVLAHVLWLQITLFPHLPAGTTFDARLRSWLAPRGLLPLPTASGIAVLPAGRALALDRGVLVGWLIEQPEVACARIERGALCPVLPRIEKEDRHEQA